MGYRENVQALCEKLGIPNPIREEDLLISAISFYIEDEPLRIEGTEMNRAGRLFFQQLSQGVVDFHVPQPWDIAAAEKFFAENWIDAETVGRPMLVAFKKANVIEYHHK